MTKVHTNTLPAKNTRKENLAPSRRSFLQKFAPASGALLAGVLSIDQNFARAKSSVKHYCCYLVKPQADCVLADCKSHFYWICSWSDHQGDVLIKCVECFDVEISIEGKRDIEGSWTEIEKHYEHLRCSKAVHPDIANFENIR